MAKLFTSAVWTVSVLAWAATYTTAFGQERPARQQTSDAMRQAATFFRTSVASHGGYVYYYSPDLQRRWGEGKATADQIWVQPPGTPTVGMAYLEAFTATGDRFYLDAATDAAMALLYGQLRSGGWTNCIDFDPRGERVAAYRNGKGNGRNLSTLDDGISQAAIRLLVHVDRAHHFQHAEIHRAATAALDALLEAQFANGGFPQVWSGPVPETPLVSRYITPPPDASGTDPDASRAQGASRATGDGESPRANYPDYDWRTLGRIKNYWDMYTLNDNLAGTVTTTLLDAYQVYQDPRYKTALQRLGDFLLRAQMPAPQPAWAQQYNAQMQPIWARRFEPPAIAGSESQDVLRALLKIYRASGEAKYLKPIPKALEYLQRSLLPDGRLARYYELETNRPLYMQRQGDRYTLTYDDSDLPKHYGWKWPSELDQIRREYQVLRAPSHDAQAAAPEDLAERSRQILQNLDDRGRWLSVYDGRRLTGQPGFAPGERYLSSEVFSRNLTALSRYFARLP